MFYYKVAIYLLLIVTITSCHNEPVDFSSPLVVSLSATDLATSIDENPTISINLGSIETNKNATFLITSQVPEGALSINAATGLVTIANISLFDFETNPIIKATVIVTSEDETTEAEITISLNNIDDIAFFLTTSKQNYIDAINDNWVVITEDEYNTLTTSLNFVNKVSTSDEFYEMDLDILAANHPSTWAHNNGINMANQSYLFAFKYYASSDNVENAKVKQSSSGIGGDYIDLGNALPIHNIGNNYFVLKGSNLPVTSDGYLAIYSPLSIGFKGFAESIYACEPGDIYSFINTNLTNSILLYQGLSTIQKQWD